MKEKFRENNDRNKFFQQILNYSDKKKKREEENQNILKEI
jgi:hypothetical protein